jgi:hypothetical protein
MAKNSESFYAHMITVMHNELMHNLGLNANNELSPYTIHVKTAVDYESSGEFLHA